MNNKERLITVFDLGGGTFDVSTISIALAQGLIVEGVMVEDNELADVATVSAGNNFEVGNMIAEAMSKVGRKGVVTLEVRKSTENTLSRLDNQPKLVDATEMTKQKLLFPSQMYPAMINFLLKCVMYKFKENNALGRSSEFLSLVETMCLLLEQAMVIEGSVELHATASKALITIGSHLPEMIASHYALKVSWLKQLLSHVDLDTHESVACDRAPNVHI
ncbi:hypothetical protein Q3G72_004892 [Acer saccharum]|nr:hypothetical protein Q3G72_004892 [Acer saccharum]